MVEQDLHIDKALNSKRLLGDAPADNFIKLVFADPVKKRQLEQWMNDPSAENAFKPLKTTFPEFKFISDAQQLPPWADPVLMKVGSAFFARHSEIIMSLLGLLSLPYCYAAANGTMVLYISELIRKQTTKRLYDTAVFVWDVMAPGAFAATGIGYQQILKVRIMHAAVRHYTLKSGKWDNSWGVPINQEDMAGTNLSFSLIVLRGLARLGFKVSQSEQEAFLHTWAVIGFLTGLNENLIPENQKMGNCLDAAIRRRQFCTSEHGKELTQSLIDHILAVNTSKATATDILGLMRYLLGEEIADMLAIKAPQLPSYKLRLIRTFNFLESFIPRRNLSQNYEKSYAAFKKLNPELSKTI